MQPNDDIAIRVEHLGKRYRIGQREPYKTLGESLTGWFRRRPTPAPTAAASADAGEFWALNDVNFEVKKGEVVGIIGRNGAGKSTLLKVLSRITEPTNGRIEITGRVGSLLEVGTGFHPELTGRENVFLNGAILGMREGEIRRNFDAIVAFAEVEQFIDTPVKRYSSGMYTRLAFAVAAHLEPEILIVDEVLAVGDAAFQKKCLGKMQNVAEQGRTVLFVSHNMPAVAALCSRCIYLENGRLLVSGRTSDVLDQYHARSNQVSKGRAALRVARKNGTGRARFTDIRLTSLDRSGRSVDVLYVGGDLRVELDVAAASSLQENNVAVIVRAADGTRLVDVNTSLDGKFLSLDAGDSATVAFVLRDLLLRPGTYSISLWIGRGGIEETDVADEIETFAVESSPDAAKHTEVFPGLYLCRFDAEISTTSGGQSQRAMVDVV